MAHSSEHIADLQEVATSGSDAVEMARRDFNFLASITSPESFIFAFPSFYLAIFQILTSFKNKVERFAIGIPRGFAKTTFVKLLCLWYILFSTRNFILIVGASEKLATNTLADICDMLSSRNIRILFGNWQAQLEEDTKEQKVFYFRGRNIILKAIGAGTAIRGINRKDSRPDVMILDDIQRKEDAPNKELADELLQWVLGTLMMARSNFGCTYIYLGNMYPQNCILEKLKNNSKWTSFIVGGILEDGTSLWEELKPVDELIAEYQSVSEMGHPEIFISEVLNSTDFAPPSGIDISAFPQLPAYFADILEEDGADGSFILIDPSSGKKTSDDLTIEHYSVVDGKVIMDHIEAGTFTPLESIKLAINMAMKNSTRLICVEDVAYQSTLLFWFDHVCREEGISGFFFEPVSPKNQRKNDRIKKGALKFLKGEAYLHPRVRSLVLQQYNEWNPLKLNNKDDIIDLPGYIEEVMQNYDTLIVKQVFDVDSYVGESTHTATLTLPF